MGRAFVTVLLHSGILDGRIRKPGRVHHETTWDGVWIFLDGMIACRGKPAELNHLEQDGQTRGRVIASTTHPSSVAIRSLRRQTPKVGSGFRSG
jgi:hypothetical protein